MNTKNLARFGALARNTTLGAALGLAAAGGAYAQAPASCDTVSALDKVVALNAIQNLVGRYSHLGQLKGEDTLEPLFAMKTEGVSWKTPNGPTGIAAMKQRFANPVETMHAGVLHMHTMFTPVIEIAGDGKTAKGVWDSFGPNVQNGQDEGSWLQGKYGVDFVKQDDGWKIWHLQFFPVYVTPYNKSITESARERAASGAAPNGPPPGSGPDARPTADAANPGPRPAGGPPPGGMPNQPWSTPGISHWIYDGKSVEQGPMIPVPYCTFDPATAY